MTIYARQIATALRMIRAKGVAVAFTYTTPGIYSPTTDTYTGAATITVAGYAVRVEGEPQKYRALDLVESQAPTLLFAPTTTGTLPEQGYKVTWSGKEYVVRDVDPVSPDTTNIIARVVVAL